MSERNTRSTSLNVRGSSYITRASASSSFTAQQMFPSIVPPVNTSASVISSGITPQLFSNVEYDTLVGPTTRKRKLPSNVPDVGPSYVALILAIKNCVPGSGGSLKVFSARISCVASGVTLLTTIDQSSLKGTAVPRGKGSSRSFCASLRCWSGSWCHLCRPGGNWNSQNPKQTENQLERPQTHAVPPPSIHFGSMASRLSKS